MPSMMIVSTTIKLSFISAADLHILVLTQVVITVLLLLWGEIIKEWQ